MGNETVKFVTERREFLRCLNPDCRSEFVFGENGKIKCCDCNSEFPDKRADSQLPTRQQALMKKNGF